ncbi:MAG: serine hydrolase [Filimonas sp.]|nr:serine hydrolase [Filimonas sp.]
MLRKTRLLSLLVLLPAVQAAAQPKTDKKLQKLIETYASPLLQRVLNAPDTFHYQFIYTRIDRDKNNVPHFTNYYLNVDRNDYFNPASTVKLPTALAALEKLNTMKAAGVDRNTTMLTDSAYPRETKVYTDASAQNGLPSISQYVKKIFLVSDNDAYNRLYEFVGQQQLNETLWKKGYTDVRITRRFAGTTEEGNRHTNPIRFMNGNTLVYGQPPAYSSIPFNYSKTILVGKGHWDDKDSLINTPMDFTRHNNLPLEDLQQIMQSVLFPESVPAKQRFNLAQDDYAFLYRYMSELPSESRFPTYDTTEYFDSYTKFFLFKAGKSKIPSNIRVFNKTGWSFGYLTDVAYIVDFKNKVEFMLTGNIYTNNDGILNDNRYEYESIGYPYFKELGNIIYQEELKRKRKHVPDLSKFVFDYKN